MYDLTQKEKSIGRLWAENLAGVLIWLAIVGIIASVVAGVFFGQSFTRSTMVGGSVGVGITLLILLPLAFTAEEQKWRRVERNYEALGKTFHNTEEKLRDADRFIKEFVGPRDVLEHMKVLQDDYRSRVTHAQIATRALAAMELNSVGKFNEEMRIVRKAWDEVSVGENILREACTMAAEHGFKVSPLEQYLGLPPIPTVVAGTEPRHEPDVVGSHSSPPCR